MSHHHAEAIFSLFKNSQLPERLSQSWIETKPLIYWKDIVVRDDNIVAIRPSGAHEEDQISGHVDLSRLEDLFSHLESLELDHNAISLAGPATLLVWHSKLNKLNLSSNGSTLRCSIGGDLRLPLLQNLYLNDNPGLSGSIDFLYSLKNVETVNLRDCSFAGPIRWQQLKNLAALKFLYLERNRLSGEIDLSALPEQIETLALTANNFETDLTSTDFGNLPTSLATLLLDFMPNGRTEKGLYGTVNLAGLHTNVRLLSFQRCPNIQAAVLPKLYHVRSAVLKKQCIYFDSTVVTKIVAESSSSSCEPIAPSPRPSAPAPKVEQREESVASAPPKPKPEPKKQEVVLEEKEKKVILPKKEEKGCCCCVCQ